MCVCNNCGRSGHEYFHCKMPITSHGVIAYRWTDDGTREYLMLRRRHSFGFIDFVRGKYSTSNIDQVRASIDEMSVEEKHLLRTCTYDQLWAYMWGCEHWTLASTTTTDPTESLHSRHKFELLRSSEGVAVGAERYTLDRLLDESATSWAETEWEFPKGRRDEAENDVECALREFSEETGMPAKSVRVIDNVLPYEEVYVGSNLKSYKHKYFLAIAEPPFSSIDAFQPSEVSKLAWMSLDQCLRAMRPYHHEKRLLLQHVDAFLANEHHELTWV